MPYKINTKTINRIQLMPAHSKLRNMFQIKNVSRRIQILVVMVVFASLGAIILNMQSSAAPAKPKPLRYSGSIIKIVADDFEAGRSRHEYYLKDDKNKTHKLKGNNADLDRLSGKRASIVGEVIGTEGAEASQIQVLAYDSVSAAATATAINPDKPLPVTSGKLLLLKFNFVNDRSATIAPAQWRTAVYNAPDSTKVMFDQSSYGRFTLGSVNRPDGDIAGPYALSMNSSTACDFNTWSAAAEAKAVAAGYNLAAYTHIVYNFPYVNSCSAGAFSDMGRSVWINGAGYTGRSLSTVVTHELGHGLKLQHSTNFVCRDTAGRKVALSANCMPTLEYGDMFTPMGYNYFQFDAFQREALGWYPPAQVKKVTASGTYTLQPIEKQGVTAGLRVLKFQRDQNNTIYIEYRQPIGLDALPSDSSPVKMNGLKVTVVEDTDTTERSASYASHLVDSTPNSNTDDSLNANDALLIPGRSITDSMTGTVIRPVTKDASGNMVVQITLGPDKLAPLAPQNLQVTTPSASKLALAWNASTDNVAVTGYRVYRNDVLMANLPAIAVTYSDATAVNHATTRYAYRVAAIDAAGNESASSNLAGTGDITPPPTPETTFIDNWDGTNIYVSWTPSTADTVSYRLYRNQVPIATVAAPATSYIDTAIQTPGNNYRYSVSAIDAAGNESPQSLSNGIEF